MDAVSSPYVQRSLAVSLACALLLAALLAPEQTLLILPVLVALAVCVLLFEMPVLFAFGLIAAYGLGLDIRIEQFGIGGALASAVVKVIPFALAAVLLLRYGPGSAVNWPFIAFSVIAGVSLAILPIGKVVSQAEMVRSFIGSTAPFALGFALAPKKVWDALARGAALVPILSAVGGLLTHIAGVYPAFDFLGRFQGLHSAPFLAGFCTTAIFAATLEYLRSGFRWPWLVVGALDLMVLLATQARAPLGAVVLFLLAVFLLSNRRVFPLKRKVDLVMGGLGPGMIVIGPVAAMAFERFLRPDFAGNSFNFSGRDIIWPYFVAAIERRPLFGFGLGAGKLIVPVDEPGIRYLGSNAAHNEYLRLSVDGGIIGCAAVFISIVAWVVVGTRHAPAADRLVLRAAVAAVLLHSAFDNTLIASTAVIQFCWFAAALARARQGARVARQRHHRHAHLARPAAAE